MVAVAAAVDVVATDAVHLAWHRDVLVVRADLTLVLLAVGMVLIHDPECEGLEALAELAVLANGGCDELARGAAHTSATVAALAVDATRAVVRVVGAVSFATAATLPGDWE